MSDALPLPPRPNLEQYKRLAKDFQHACRSSDSGAIGQWAVRWAETITRLQGIEITPQVRREVDREAQRIQQRWHKFKETEERASQCLLADAQLFVARGHGFASWPKFAKHVDALARANTPVSKFEAAVDAIVGGDSGMLQRLLRENPELVRARSTREHHSTLLHYVSANGVEDFRQKTPGNIVEIAKILLDAGADANAGSEAYGGGSTTLGLVATSLHPQQAGVQIALLQTLLDGGARIDHSSAIRDCFANGQPEAAEFLANRGAPLDLEGAAGLGRLDVVKSYFDENGVLKPPATQQQLEAGFLSACGYGRKDVVEFLLERGVSPDLQNEGRQTACHCAAYGAHVEVMRLLIDRGSPVGLKDKAFHATPLDVALWAWNHFPDQVERERCYEVIALLARAGAKLDPQQWHNPDEAGSGMLEKIRSDPRMLAALKGDVV